MIDIKKMILEATIAVVALGLLFATTLAYSNEGDNRTESLVYMATLPKAPVAALHWGKDPFVPLISGTDAPQMKLTAIFYNTTNPSAIINGNVVYKQSSVAGQKVIDIGKTHVILQGLSGSITLEIAGLPTFPEAMKHPVSQGFDKPLKTGLQRVK